MKITQLGERAAAVLCALLAGGCSGFLHSSARPEQTYYLRAGAAAGTPPSAVPVASLRVGQPAGAPGLDSAHIVLVQPDNRMGFYTGSRWPAPAPQLIGALAVQTLRASGNFTSVEDSASPFPSDFLLQITVRRFEADYAAAGAAPEVQVVLDCIIGRRGGRDVVGTFEVSGAAPAAANRMAEVIAAFEQATNTALAGLSQQAGAAVRAAQRAPQNTDSPAPSNSRQSQ